MYRPKDKEVMTKAIEAEDVGSTALAVCILPMGRGGSSDRVQPREVRERVVWTLRRRVNRSPTARAMGSTPCPKGDGPSRVSRQLPKGTNGDGHLTNQF